MKKSALLLLSLVLLFSCVNQTKQKKDEKSAELVALTVDELQSKGKELLGKEVMVKGTVTHVCKENGGRCFLMGSTEDISIRIEAGKIGSFTQDLMGSELQVKGILLEVQLDEEDLADMEQSSTLSEPESKEKAPGIEMHVVDGGQHDSLTRANKIGELNKKLIESKEGYVPVYYLEGIELVKQK